MSIIPYTTGNFPTYRFYVSEASSVSYEVFPLNFLSSSLVDSLEGDQIFYRRKFAGSLTFGTNSLVIDDSGVTQNRRDDWQFFWDQEQHDSCAKLFFTITKTVSGVTTTYWEGYFSTTDGKFDLDNCTFEISPMTDDDYTDLLAEADTQYNILSVTPTVTTNIYGTTTQFTRNRWLLDVIEYLADKVIPGVTVSSDYFTAATNPATLNANKLLYLTIAQKSDIIRPTSSDPATIAMMSWTELIEILWVMFQVKWEYDLGTNTINVEHVSWWTKGAGIDLRTQLSCKATNKYSYLKEKMPKYEKFSFMEAFDGNFVGTPIWYDSGCVNPDPKSNVKELAINVTTDLQYIIDNPTAIFDDGFVILCNYLSGGIYYVQPDNGLLVPGSLLNMHLSWANLQDSYFRHNRVMIEGYMNTILTTFWTAQKTKVQECSAIICDTFDPIEEITTELGETYFSGAKGTVDKAELNPSGELKLTLCYGPPDNENTGVVGEKIITITEVTGANSSHFYAVCNQPADIELTITTYLTCRDGDGITCDSDVGTITISAGSIMADIIVGWCEPVATPAICVASYHPDVTGAPGWTVNWIYDIDSYC